VIPVLLLDWPNMQEWNRFTFIILGWWTLPHIIAGVMAYIVRTDERASRIVAKVASINVVLGLFLLILFLAGQGGMVLCGLFLLPCVQALIGLAGAVISGSRPVSPPADEGQAELGLGHELQE